MLVKTEQRAQLAIFAALLGMAGCGAGRLHDDNAQGSTCSAIIGGDAAAPSSLETARQLAVAGLLTAVDATGLCSAVVVAQGVALTAAHCLAEDQATLVFGADVDSGVLVKALSARAHPELDVAILTFDASALNLLPLPLVDLPLDDALIGTQVELAGFGVNDRGSTGKRLYVTETVVALSDTHVDVEGDGQTGACVGDSGGPLLARARDGSIQTIGILDSGSASCQGLDSYTRGDVLRPWVAELSAVAACD